MTADLLDYPAEVQRLFEALPRSGRFPAKEAKNVVVAEVGTPAAPFKLRLELKLAADNSVGDARYSAIGCPFTIAVGAWAAEWIVGRSPSEIQAFSADQCRAALEIPADRAHCWLMAQDLMCAVDQKLSSD